MTEPQSVPMPGQVWGLAAPDTGGPIFVTSYDGKNLSVTHPCVRPLPNGIQQVIDVAPLLDGPRLRPSTRRPHHIPFPS
ncbi:hypothetical protein [Streptomyces sp. NPDC091416]|uniref:hypothetical protein n=1 Tax=Streptomyces sp. NPDC091416 TaxID=3366003 RepID=UPI003822B648